MKRVECAVYRGRRKAETYLYVAAAEGLARVPPALLASFGELEPFLRVELHAGRRLARADAAQVLRALEECGYYLQMPPATDLFPPASEGS